MVNVWGSSLKKLVLMILVARFRAWPEVFRVSVSVVNFLCWAASFVMLFTLILLVLSSGFWQREPEQLVSKMILDRSALNPKTKALNYCSRNILPTLMCFPKPWSEASRRTNTTKSTHSRLESIHSSTTTSSQNLDFEPWVLESRTLNSAHKSWTPNRENFGWSSNTPELEPANHKF